MMRVADELEADVPYISVKRSRLSQLCIHRDVSRSMQLTSPPMRALRFKLTGRFLNGCPIDADSQSSQSLSHSPSLHQ